MLGPYVASDLEIDSIHIPTNTKAGAKQFSNQLNHPTAEIPSLKKIQTPLLALRRVDTSSLQKELQLFQSTEETFNEFGTSTDPLVEESTEQIIWNPGSMMGRLCNQSPLFLEAMIAWKTLALPGITVLSPFFAILLPYIFLYIHGMHPSFQEYLTTIRNVVRGAVTVPSILQAKGEGDRKSVV